MSTLLAEPATARTQILLTPSLKDAAQRRCRRIGVSLGQLIRHLLAKEVDGDRWAVDGEDDPCREIFSMGRYEYRCDLPLGHSGDHDNPHA